MTVAAATPINSFVGNGSASSFSFTFPVFLNTQILVTVTQTTTGAVSTLVLGTDYTVSGLNTSGDPATTGTIALVNSSQAWLSSGNLATGFTLVIQSNFPLSQTTSIRNQGDFYRAALENALDTLEYQIQQLELQIGSQLILPTGLLPSAFSPILPAGMPSSAGLALVVNSTGTGFALGAGGSVTLPVKIAQGGTNSSAALANGKLMASSGGAVVESAITTPTNWASYTPTFSAGFGTPTSISVFWRRVGDTIEVKGKFKCGTVAGSNGKIGLPNSLLIDATKIPTGSTDYCGSILALNTAGPSTIYATNVIGFLFADGSNNDGVFFSYQSQNFLFVSNNVNAMFANGDVVPFYFSVPVV